MSQPDPYIFISHSSQDNPAVAEIVDDLQARGVRVWLDLDRLKSGQQWLSDIEAAIDDCAGFMVIISKTSRRAEWVMRECLYAMQLRKPVFIARIDDVPLPLLLVDRHYADFAADYDKALVDTVTSVEKCLANPPATLTKQPLPDHVSLDPNEANFFSYLAQMERGDLQAQVARDLFQWANQQAAITDFSGRFRPALHVKVTLKQKQVTVFSILAYLRHPAVQVPLDYLSKYPPYTEQAERVRLLRLLDELSPATDPFEDSRADRRPTIPLAALLASDARLTQFKAMVTQIMSALQASA